MGVTGYEELSFHPCKHPNLDRVGLSRHRNDARMRITFRKRVEIPNRQCDNAFVYRRGWFPNGEVGLVIDYETNIPPDRKVELRSEVDKMFEQLRTRIEAKGVGVAVIRAIHKSSASGYGFVFRRTPESQWYCTDDLISK